MEKSKLNLAALAVALVIGLLTYILIKRKPWEGVYDTSGRVKK